MFEVTILFRSAAKITFECESFKFIQRDNKLVAYNVNFGKSNNKFYYVDMSFVDAITYKVIEE